MNKKDLLIISHLRKNARESLTNMSKRTKIPISTIYERLKNKSGGLIKKHTALIDFNKLGYMTHAHIMVKTSKESKKEIAEFLRTSAPVNSLYRINNGFDYLIEGVFRHIKDMEEFMDNLEDRFDIVEKNVYYLINDLKRECFMSDPVLMNI